MTTNLFINIEQILDDFEETEACSILPFMLKEIERGCDKSSWYHDIMHFVYSENIRLKPLIYKFINCYDLPEYAKIIQHAVCIDLQSDKKELIIAALNFLKEVNVIFDSCAKYVMNLVFHNDSIVKNLAHLAFIKLFMIELSDKNREKIRRLKFICNFDEYEHLRVLYKGYRIRFFDSEDICKKLSSSCKIEVNLLYLLILYKETIKILETQKLENYEFVEEKKNRNNFFQHEYKSLTTILDIADLLHSELELDMKRYKEIFKDNFHLISRYFHNIPRGDNNLIISCKIILIINNEIAKLLFKVVLCFVNKNLQISSKLYEYIREFINNITLFETNCNMFTKCVSDDFYIKRSKMNSDTAKLPVFLQKKVRKKTQKKQLEYICMLVCCEKNFMFNDFFDYHTKTHICFKELILESHEYYNQINEVIATYKNEETNKMVENQNEYLENIELDYIKINKAVKEKFCAEISDKFHWFLRIRGISLENFIDLYYRKYEVYNFLSLINKEKLKHQEFCTSFPLNIYTDISMYEVCEICCKACQLKDTEKKRLQAAILVNFNLDDVNANVVVIQKNVYLDILTIKKTTKYKFFSFSSVFDKPGLIKICELSNNFDYGYYNVEISECTQNFRIDLLDLVKYPFCTLSEFVTGFNFLTETIKFNPRSNYVWGNQTYKRFLFFMIFDALFFGVHIENKIILKSNNRVMLNNLRSMYGIDNFLNINFEISVFCNLQTNEIFQKYMEFCLII